MVRGPRRVGTPRQGQAPAEDSRAERRLERKMARVAERSHSALANGWVGRSIQERVEDRITDSCRTLLRLRESDRQDSTDNIRVWRGEIRGLAIALALMRHPDKAYSVAWWAYVKKLEKRHMARAKEMDDA